MNIKDLKLSEAMINAIKLGRDNAGAFGTVPDGTAGTIKALAARGLVEKIEGSSLSILNAAGLAVRAAILNGLNAYEVPASEDHPAMSDMITDPWDAPKLETLDLVPIMKCRRCKDSGREPGSWREDCTVCKSPDPQCYCSNDSEICPNCNGHEFRGDAERTYDVENAAAEAADIRAEYEAELMSELVSEILADDALMHLTPKGIFVSGSYMNTMRRLAAVKRSDASGFALQRQHMIDEAPNLFALIDRVLESGEITFGEADREKRRIRAHCRPSVLAGRKHKPSAKRRNRR